MRILHVCIYYKPSVGGVENFVHNVVTELSALGKQENNSVEQMVVCFQRGNEPQDSKVDGIPVYRFRPLITISSQSVVPFLASRLTKILQSFRPDIVFFHYPNPLLSNALLKALKKSGLHCRLFVHWHGDIVGRAFLRPWYTQSTVRLLKTADKISSDTLEYAEGSPLLKPYSAKIEMIPAIPNFEDLTASPIDLPVQKWIEDKAAGRHVCFCMGRLVKWKGFQYAIESFQYLPPDKYVLIIGGSGKYERHLKKMASKRGNIFFFGNVSPAQKKTFFQESSCFLFTSVGRQEAFGITLAEAMLSGVPSILFDIPYLGDRYIAENNVNCLMVEPGNAFQLSKAIETVCNDKEKSISIGQASQHCVKEKMNYDIFSSAVQNYFFEKK